MEREFTITEARSRLTVLPDEFAKDPRTVAITRRGRRVMALLPWDLYDAIAETLEIMSDKELLAELRKSIAEADKGNSIPWKRVKADLRR